MEKRSAVDADRRLRSPDEQAAPGDARKNQSPVGRIKDRTVEERRYAGAENNAKRNSLHRKFPLSNAEW